MSNYTQAVPFNLRDRVTVYATSKNPYEKEGTKMQMGKLAAEFAVKNGYASEKEPAKTKKASE